MRYYLLVTLWLLLAAPTFAQEVKLSREAKLYARPDSTSTIRTFLPTGLKLKILSKRGDWLAVTTSEGLLGWIQKSDTENTPAKTETVESEESTDDLLRSIRELAGESDMPNATDEEPPSPEVTRENTLPPLPPPPGWQRDAVTKDSSTTEPAGLTGSTESLRSDYPVEDTGAVTFVAYDVPPMPIGGLEAMQEMLEFPKGAGKAGAEEHVVVQVLISEKGEVLQTKILKSSGNGPLDEAAVNALKTAKWKPALKGDKPVKVWVTFPVIFKLK